MRFVLALAAAFALAGCAAAGPRAPDLALTSDAGMPWRLSEQLAQGKGVAITFGYTHCLDTCPLTLHLLAKARKAGGTEKSVEIVFVTVDPARDTPSVLHRYLSSFGGGIVGLTGSTTQIAAAEAAYHVWAQRVPGARGAYGYDEAHTSTVFFVDPRGSIVAMRDSTDSIEALAGAFRLALAFFGQNIVGVSTRQ